MSVIAIGLGGCFFKSVPTPHCLLQMLGISVLVLFQNGVTCVRPASANQDLIPNLIAVTASPRNVTFHESTRNYLVSTEILGQ